MELYMNNTVLQIRVDEKLKNNASDIFEDIGLDLSTAIRLFLNKTVALNDLPFEINNNKKQLKKQHQYVDLEYLNLFMNTEKSAYTKINIDDYLSESRNDRLF